MLKSLSMVVLVMAAVPALAGLEGSSSATGAQGKDPNRRICKTVEETGSRLGSTRICMTAAQWEAQLSKTRDDGDRAANDRSGQ